MLGGHQNGEPAFGGSADGIAEGRGLARLAVEVSGGEFASGGDFAGLGVAHLVHQADRLVADLEQHTFDLDNIAGQQFALVGDALLRRDHAVAGFPQVSRRQSDPRKQIPVGLVEFADVPHDVHVADMVALPRIDRAAIGCCRFH
jgi:hypothetical protein